MKQSLDYFVLKLTKIINKFTKFIEYCWAYKISKSIYKHFYKKYRHISSIMKQSLEHFVLKLTKMINKFTKFIEYCCAYKIS